MKTDGVYFCADSAPQPKIRRKAQRGWKIVESDQANGEIRNPRTGEILIIKGRVVERFILRAGPNKGKPIYRSEMSVVRV